MGFFDQAVVKRLRDPLGSAVQLARARPARAASAARAIEYSDLRRADRFGWAAVQADRPREATRLQTRRQSRGNSQRELESPARGRFPRLDPIGTSVGAAFPNLRRLPLPR